MDDTTLHIRVPDELYFALLKAKGGLKAKTWVELLGKLVELHEKSKKEVKK